MLNTYEDYSTDTPPEDEYLKALYEQSQATTPAPTATPAPAEENKDTSTPAAQNTSVEAAPSTNKSTGNLQADWTDYLKSTGVTGAAARSSTPDLVSGFNKDYQGYGITAGTPNAAGLTDVINTPGGMIDYIHGGDNAFQWITPNESTPATQSSSAADGAYHVKTPSAPFVPSTQIIQSPSLFSGSNTQLDAYLKQLQDLITTTSAGSSFAPADPIKSSFTAQPDPVSALTPYAADPRIAEYMDMLKAIYSSPDPAPARPVDPNDPIIKGQTESYDAKQQRARRNYLAALAEKVGSNANISQETRASAEAGGQATAEYQAKLMSDELAARRAIAESALNRHAAEVQSARGQYGTQLTEADQRQIQEQQLGLQDSAQMAAQRVQQQQLRLQDTGQQIQQQYQHDQLQLQDIMSQRSQVQNALTLYGSQLTEQQRLALQEELTKLQIAQTALENSNTLAERAYEFDANQDYLYSPLASGG